MAFAIDAAGNVATTTNKGDLHIAVTPPPPPAGLTVTVSGDPAPANNEWLQSASVTIQGDTGVQFDYNIDGGPSTLYSSPFAITGDGLHFVDVHGSDGSQGTALVPVDDTPPLVSIVVPASGGTGTYSLNQVVAANYSCADAGSGVSSLVLLSVVLVFTKPDWPFRWFAIAGLVCGVINGVLITDSSLAEADAHLAEDLRASILLGAGVMAVRPGTQWIDPVLSLGIAGLILFGATRLVLEITEILMESVPRHIDVTSVIQRISCCSGVLAVHDVHVWTISSGLHALSAHVVVRLDEAGPRNDAILDEVKRELRQAFGIDHTTLQIESAGYAHVDDVHTH